MILQTMWVVLSCAAVVQAQNREQPTATETRPQRSKTVRPVTAREIVASSGESRPDGPRTLRVPGSGPTKGDIPGGIASCINTCTLLPPPSHLTAGGWLSWTNDNLCATFPSDCPGFGAYPSAWDPAFQTSEPLDVTLTYCGSINQFQNAWLNLAVDCPCSGYSDAATYAFSCDDGRLEMTWYNLPPGTYYYPILYDPSYDAAGMYTITVSATGFGPPPPNDDCGSVSPATLTPGQSVTFSGTTANATNDCALWSYRDAWEAVTLTDEADLVVDYCGTFPPFSTFFIVLVDGCPCGSYRFASDYDFYACGDGNATIYYFGLTPGTYYVPIYSEAGAIGPYTMTITATAPPPRPPNDDCSAVTPVPLQAGSSLVFNGDNSGATKDCLNLLTFGTGETWEAFQATECMDVTIELCGTSPQWTNAYIVLVEGCPCASLVYSALYDYGCADGNLRILWHDLPPGTYYYPVLNDPGSGALGPYTVTIRGDACPGGPCRAIAINRYEYIDGVVVADLSNINGLLSPAGYADYTHLSANMTEGQSYSISVSVGSAYIADIGGAWVDWNGDQDFDDAGETVVLAGSGAGPYTGTISVPLGLPAGSVRLRVRMVDGSVDVLAPCGTSNWGETEDYTINLVRNCTPCDTTCDGTLNGQDIGAFIGLLSGGSGCSTCAGDTNSDGSLNGADISGFICCLREATGLCDDGDPCTIDVCTGGECVHLPSPECDFFCSTAAIMINVGGNTFPVYLTSGLTYDTEVKLDQPPYANGQTIHTEIVKLELEGTCLLGRVLVHEDPARASTGTITNVTADLNGNFVSGDSTFGVYPLVELPDFMGGVTADTNGVPVTLEALDIVELPPYGTSYLPPFPESLPIYVNGVQIATLLHAEHKVSCPCEIELTKCPPDWLPEGRKFGTAVGDPGNSVTFTATVKRGAPRKVRFMLEGVSSEPGVCINYGGESGDAPDLKFIQTATVNPPAIFDPPSADGMTIQTKNKVTSVTVTVTCYDWGAWGRIRACCLDPNDGDCENFSETRDIPVDDVGANHMGDAWWPSMQPNPATWDDDPYPDNMKRNGDGFSFYEEYRGTMDGFLGAHQRLFPLVKDLFIYDEDLLHLNSHSGHSYISVTGILVQYVNADPNQLWSGAGLAADDKRIINYKSEFAKLADQFGLHVVDTDLGGPVSWGRTDGPTIGPPKTADPLVNIDVAQHGTDLGVAVTEQGGNPAGAEKAAYDDVLKREIAVSVTHEMGHGTGVRHHRCANGGRQSPYDDTNCGEVMCVMRYDFDLVDSRHRTSNRSGAAVDNDAGFVLTDAGAGFVAWNVAAGSDTVVITGGTGVTPGTYAVTARTATTLTLGADAGDSNGTADVDYYINTTHVNLWGARTADKSPAGTLPARFVFSNYTDKDLSDLTPVLNIFCIADNKCRQQLDVKDD